jgi:hypothetical protein
VLDHDAQESRRLKKTKKFQFIMHHDDASERKKKEKTKRRGKTTGKGKKEKENALSSLRAGV